MNKLSDSELSFLTNILNKNGLWGRMSGLSNTEKKKQLKNKRKGNAEFQSILVDVVNSTDMKEKIEQIVLVCLSEVYDSMLMWSHYAQNHRFGLTFILARR